MARDIRILEIEHTEIGTRPTTLQGSPPRPFNHNEQQGAALSAVQEDETKTFSLGRLNHQA